MKKARLSRKDDRTGPKIPAFLGEDEEVIHQLGDPRTRGAAWVPGWGLRQQDTLVGSTAHSRDWSKHCVTPHDYADIVVPSSLESAELMGAQAIATVRNTFL